MAIFREMAKVTSMLTHPISTDSLNATQKRQFDEEGYCVVRGLWTAAEIAAMEAYFEEFKVHGPKIFSGPQGRVGYDEVDKTKSQVRAMHPHRHSAKALQWLIHPPVAAVLEALFGCPPLGAQTMYYYKPPGSKGQGMHQDNFYLLASPHECIAAWTAVDSADLDNGCLYVVPGSHKGEIYCPDTKDQRWMGYGDSHISKFPRGTKPVPVPVQRGETMFFGGKLIHGSGPNRTMDRNRRTFIGHYVSQATEELSKFYHPVFDMRGNVMSGIAERSGGGPCGDDWLGANH